MATNGGIIGPENKPTQSKVTTFTSTGTYSPTTVGQSKHSALVVAGGGGGGGGMGGAGGGGGVRSSFGSQFTGGGSATPPCDIVPMIVFGTSCVLFCETYKQ